MALVPPIDASPDEVRAWLAPLRNDFSVAVYKAENAFAVGGIIRVAHNFLAREVILVGDEPHYEKASMGMHKYESIVRVADTSALLAHVHGRPIWAVEKDAARKSVTAVPAFPRDTVFVLGSERFGLPGELLERADEVVGIPIYGINQSLPLVVAAGIVMHEWARRRYREGSIA
jgi:tRNA G18 (ribose-2'-O)-methylase SpoU